MTGHQKMIVAIVGIWVMGGLAAQVLGKKVA